MANVYYDDFIMFANWPFVLASVFVLVTLLAAWCARRSQNDKKVGVSLPAVLLLMALILLWILLSEQVFMFWYCGHEYGDIGFNWKFAAQMYMSVTWAIYAAVLLVIGFLCRTRGIRYLSLAIFAVLLAKIFIVDTATLKTEYRIAAFLTTGLVLVGVSFLYQFLKKKGFFETIENQIETANERE